MGATVGAGLRKAPWGSLAAIGTPSFGGGVMVSHNYIS